MAIISNEKIDEMNPCTFKQELTLFHESMYVQTRVKAISWSIKGN